MMSPENQLVEDLVTYWRANRPAGLPVDWPIYHFQSQDTREVPHLVIGHEGAKREPSMPDTVHAQLRVMLVTSMDETDPVIHREVAGDMEAALVAMTTKPGPLPLTWIHAFLKEPPKQGVDGRREFTEVRRTAVVSRSATA